MKIRPKDAAVYAFDGVHHVVVIVPVDGDIDKAQDIAEEDVADGAQRLKSIAFRHFELQNHDGDDDRDNAVTQGFKAIFLHGEKKMAPPTRLERARTAPEAAALSTELRGQLVIVYRKNPFGQVKILYEIKTRGKVPQDRRFVNHFQSA